MWIQKVALAACGLLACTLSIAQEPASLSLDTVLQRVIAQHPELQLLELERVALEAERAQASHRPGRAVQFEGENFVGTGARSGLSGAEWTLSLAGVLERGGRRAAREALAARRLDAEGPRRVGVQLDLLAEAARRYLAVVEAQHEKQILSDDLAAREHVLEVASQRVKAGATPVSVSLAADVAVANARMQSARAVARHAAAWQRLAALWGGTSEPAPQTTANPLRLPVMPAEQELLELVERNPELQLLAAEGRIREARLQLAEAARVPDLEWRAGVRRLEDGNDWAIVAGVSLPLGTRARAAPGIGAARAQLDALAFERQATNRRLAALLVQASGLFADAQIQVDQTGENLLPRYDEAIAAAERAFRAGATGPLDWMQLQNERLAARRAQLAAAIAAHLSLIEIQRLTAEPLRGLVAQAGDKP